MVLSGGDGVLLQLEGQEPCDKAPCAKSVGLRQHLAWLESVWMLPAAPNAVVPLFALSTPVASRQDAIVLTHRK